MDDVKGYTIFGCACVLGLVIIIIANICYRNEKNSKISEMVKSGADPVACAIALDNIYDDQAKTYFISKK